MLRVEGCAFGVGRLLARNDLVVAMLMTSAPKLEVVKTMAIAKRFEDLGIWREARELVRQVYEVTASSTFGQDMVLSDQMRKAALSVMANIAEGFGRRTNRDFARFLAQARGSASELQSHLYVALDQRYIDEACFSDLYEKCDRISRMLHRLTAYLHGNSTRNPQRATRNSQPSTPHSELSTKGVRSGD